jgi:hypothetical protein
MSPGTDFSMYQKVASSIMSNVPIDHSRAKHRSPRIAYRAVLAGAADEESKMNAAKKHQQILGHNRRIHSSNGQTWTTSAIPETNFARTFEGITRRQAVKVKKTATVTLIS